LKKVTKMKFIVAVASFVAATHAIDQKRSDRFDVDTKQLSDEMFSNIERQMMDTHKKMTEPFLKETSTSKKFTPKGQGLDED